MNENMDIVFIDINDKDVFRDWIATAREILGKNEQLKLTSENIYIVKEAISAFKRHPTEWKKKITHCTVNKGLLCKKQPPGPTKKKYIQCNSKKPNKH